MCNYCMYYLFGRHRRPYIVFRNYVDVWLPVRSLVYIYIYLSKNGGRKACAKTFSTRYGLEKLTAKKSQSEIG